MKKFHNSNILKYLSAIAMIGIADNSYAARYDNTFVPRNKQVFVYGSTLGRSTNSYIAIANDKLNGSASLEAECVEYFIKALDRGCYNFTDSRISVYAECANYSSTELLDVIDANFSYILPYSDASSTYRRCKDFRSTAVGKFLVQKDVIEQAARKNNPECVKSKNDLNLAKKCYIAVMASSGSFLDPLPECDSVPGGKVKQAGKFGYSNLLTPALNIASGQLTDKRPNWREAVEAVLAGYIMQAQTSCDDNSFANLSINSFTPDNQNNFLKTALTENMVSAFSNTNMQAQAQNLNNVVLQSNSGSSSASSQISRQANSLDTEITGGVFLIDAEMIPLSKQRLEMILTNPSYYDISNSVDIAIARSVYGTLITANNRALFNKYISDMSSKTNVFVIRSMTDEGYECVVYKAIGGQVVSITAEIASQSRKISTNLNSCDILKSY